MIRKLERPNRGTLRIVGVLAALLLGVVTARVVSELAQRLSSSDSDAGVAYAAVPEAPVAPLNDEDRGKLLELSDLMMHGIAEGDLGVFREAFWVDKFVDRCLGGLKVGRVERDAFTDGISRVVLSSDQLQKTWAGWEFKRVRFFEEKGHPRVLVRVTGEHVGLNYMIWYAAKDPSGDLRFYNYYSFAAGESLCDIGRRFSAMAFAKTNATLAKRLLGTDEGVLEHFPKFQQMGQAVLRGDPQRGIALYRSLPKVLRDDKVVLLLFLRALSDAERTEDYLASVERFRRLYPGDESLALVLIDYYTAKNDVPRVIAAIDALSERVFDDPYLDILRAHVSLTHDAFEAAERYVRRAIAADPREEIAYWTLVNVGLTTRRYGVVNEALDVMTRDFGYEFTLEALGKNPDYRDYAKSPEARSHFGGDSSKGATTPKKKAPAPTPRSEPAPILEDF